MRGCSLAIAIIVGTVVMLAVAPEPTLNLLEAIIALAAESMRLLQGLIEWVTELLRAIR